MTIPDFTMRRSDGGNIVERRNNDYDYRAYSAIPGFYEDFEFPSDHPISYATCSSGNCFSNGLKKCVKCGSTSSKAKVRAQLDAAKKKATPKGETPAQTTKRSQETAKKVIAKHKACGPGKAFNTRENRCEDIEKNAPSSVKEALAKKYVPIRAAEIQKALAQQNQMFGSTSISQASKILNAKRAGQDTSKLEEGMKFIKTKHGQLVLAKAQAVRANEVNASRATDAKERQGFINQANIARRAVDVEYASWREAHLASGYAKNPGAANMLSPLLPGIQNVVDKLDPEGKALTIAEQQALKAPIPVPIKTALNVGGEYLFGLATGEQMDVNDMRASLVRNITGIDPSKFTGDLTKDIPNVLMQMIKSPFGGFGFEAPDAPIKTPEGAKGYTDIPEPKKTVMLI